MAPSFLDSPIDYRALRTVLATFAAAGLRSDLHAILMELGILLDEAERSPRKEVWDARILDRWREFEAVLTRGDGIATALAPDGNVPAP